MKTLIFNGSPRKEGNTAYIVKKITDGIEGEYRIVDAYRCNISPCVDCRYCKTNNGCAINDEMQEIYKYIEECDNILIASPIYFSEITGKLLDVGSRIQKYFCARYFRKENPISKPKRGAIILVSGSDTEEMNKAFLTAKILLHQMNCTQIHEALCCRNTDNVAAADNTDLITKIKNLIKFLNREDKECTNSPI